MLILISKGIQVETVSSNILAYNTGLYLKRSLQDELENMSAIQTEEILTHSNMHTLVMASMCDASLHVCSPSQ